MTMMMALLGLLMVKVGVCLTSSSPLVDRTIAARSALMEALREEREESVLRALLEIQECSAEFVSGDFIDLAVNGDWELLYPLVKSTTVLIDGIDQHVEVVEGAGAATNSIRWTFDEDRGVFETKSTLRATEDARSDFLFSLEGHYLKPAKKLTSDAAEVVDSMARTVPFELFDPDLSVASLVYADPLLKIMKVTGGKRKRPGFECHVWGRKEKEPKSSSPRR